jgi:hypothetical protein
MHLLALTLALLMAPSVPKSDSAIEADIRARLARSKIAVNGFEVRVRNGTAVWTGRTNVVQHKGAATRMAKSAGAKSVDNRIEISAVAKAKAAATMRKHQRTQPRTEPRTEQPRAEAADTFVPPPVRRAVIKKPGS